MVCLAVHPSSTPVSRASPDCTRQSMHRTPRCCFGRSRQPEAHRTQTTAARQLIASIGESPAAPTASPSEAWQPGSWFLPAVALQLLTLSGSLVGGHLARKRRKELEVLNGKLREVLKEVREKREAEQEDILVCEANPEEALLAYRKALESSMVQPSAAHPVEGYGADGSSLASSRRRVSKLLKDGRTAMSTGDYTATKVACDTALLLTNEIMDKRASRAVLKLKGKALNKLGEYKSAAHTLEEVLSISTALGETAGDLDTLGSLADVYVELGNYEKASTLYDRVLIAVQEDSDEVNPYMSWDC